MAFCSGGKGTALDGPARQLHLLNKRVLPPLKLTTLLGKERIYFNSFSVKVVPYFQFLTLKLFHLADIIQFDAPFYGVTAESQSNGKWPEQDSSLS